MFDARFSHLVTAKAAKPVRLLALEADDLARWTKDASAAWKTWVKAAGFTAQAGTWCALPEDDGGVRTILAGLGGEPVDRLWDWAKVFEQLPAGDYAPLAADGQPLGRAEADRALLGRLLGGYRFSHYKSAARAGGGADKRARIVVPKNAERAAIERAAQGIWLVRDLVNEPAGSLGPSALAAAARKIAKRFKARCSVIVGGDLLKKNYPAIHAVGRASSDAPRLIDLRWGDTRHPKVTLVGKGVCFDSGGLDVKSAAGMKLMKKDMGGAAHVLALGAMIMDAKLPVRLRVLVPAVENAIAGNAMRPLDVVETRAGLTIEIGHTDAEGRVILADAISEAVGEAPEMLIDCATLTGAARVALGTEIPALFCNDDDLAAALLLASGETADPLWRMPLWQGYGRLVDGKVADVTNAPEGGYGGAITAALFLERFVNKPAPGSKAGRAGGKDFKPVPWAHLDMMAWNVSSRPGRPEGGEAMGLRALYACIRDRFAAA